MLELQRSRFAMRQNVVGGQIVLENIFSLIHNKLELNRE